MNKLWSLVLAALLVVAHADADARRMGGGKSFGKQSSNVTQRESARPAATPGAPAQNAASNQATPRQAGAPGAGSAAAPKKPWGAMLGGLAAGLGLAWLASSLGLGAEFGQFLLMGLLALVIMMVVGKIMRARKGAASSNPHAGAPLAFQGASPAGTTGSSSPNPFGAPHDAAVPRQYSPDKVGNDASARPWEQTGAAFQAAPSGNGSMIGAALAGAQNWSIPEGFDAESFLSAAKRNFITLQAAWDRSDIPALRAMMTDDMLEEIRAQLSEREAHRGDAPPNQTDVVMLEAQLLGIEDLGADYMASVEFSGMIREEPSAGPSPFREVWNMAKPKDGNSGWLVAGLQALQ